MVSGSALFLSLCMHGALLCFQEALAENFQHHKLLCPQWMLAMEEHTQTGSSKTQGPCSLQRAQHDLQLHGAVQLEQQDRDLCSLSCPCSSLPMHRRRHGRERQQGPACPRAQDLCCFSSMDRATSQMKKTNCLIREGKAKG